MKLLSNSVISTVQATFMTINIKNFYLKTQMERYEYLCLKMADMTANDIQEYKLRDIVTKDGYVYTKCWKGIYGLPQAGILVHQLIEKRLGQHGCTQSKITPGFRLTLGHISVLPCLSRTLA